MSSSEGEGAAAATIAAGVGSDADTDHFRAPTLLEEVEEMLAQSLLIFLVADLRLMSATGRIETKYETLAIASDPPTRATAAQLAGIDDYNADKCARSLRHQNEGLSPAQIMAVLLVELSKTVEAKRKEEKRVAQRNARTANEFKDDTFTNFEADAEGNVKIRAKEDNMNALLKAYAEMISQDIKAEVPHIERRLSMMNLSITGSTNKAPSPLNKLEPVVEELEQESEKNEGEDGAVAAGETQQMAKERLGIRTSRIARAAKLERLRSELDLRISLPKNQDVRTQQRYRELTDALFQTGDTTRELRASISASLTADGSRERDFTKEELLEFVSKAVESRVYGKLDFMADFFKPGTVSQLCAQSKSRLVWMNDWYPLKDLTYAIAVDEEKKRVLVVFRGAITRQDWSRGFESRNFRKIPNPIEEDYEEKTDTIAVSSGFYEYLFRRRKDTGTVKYDEIANIACKYGHERIGANFSLVVTGHSLGGALSTLFSFFASTDDRFTRNGPVKVFNFGSPYVGGRRFMLAFQQQEKRKKLQFARFFNHNDIVAHLPFNFEVTKDGGKFRHVGIGIRLYSAPTTIFRFHIWRPAEVFYLKDEGFVRSYWRAIRNNFILKFPIPPWRFAQMHTLNELQERLAYGARLQGGGKDFLLLNKTIDELYEMFVGADQEPESK